MTAHDRLVIDALINEKLGLHRSIAQLTADLALADQIMERQSAKIAELAEEAESAEAELTLLRGDIALCRLNVQVLEGQLAQLRSQAAGAAEIAPEDYEQKVT